MRNFLLGIVFTLLVIVIGVIWIAKSGRVNFEADQQPSSMERSFAMGAVDASTEKHAGEAKNPLASTEDNIVAGAQIYLDHCAGCHGLPSNADSQFGRSFNPPVPAFFTDAPDMPENQNFYIVQHGIRWSGMPAWNKTLNEKQIWQVVTFMSNIEKLPAQAKKILDVTATAAPIGR